MANLSHDPVGAIFGPKVMIINHPLGQVAMPCLVFRKAGLGTLVGVQTWGGLVGIGGYPPLIGWWRGDSSAVCHLRAARGLGGRRSRHQSRMLKWRNIRRMSRLGTIYSWSAQLKIVMQQLKGIPCRRHRSRLIRTTIQNDGLGHP